MLKGETLLREATMNLNFLTKLGFIALMAVLLAACEITITGEPGPGPVPGLPPDLDIYRASFDTDYQADVDVDGDYEFVICDDRTTNLTYTFTFDGDLDSWESYLSGERGEVVGRETLTVGSRYVDYNSRTNTVTVKYQIERGGAPDIVTTQDIVIRPKVDRYVRLYLKVDGYAKAYDLISKQIPVLVACG